MNKRAGAPTKPMSNKEGPAAVYNRDLQLELKTGMQEIRSTAGNGKKGPSGAPPLEPPSKFTAMEHNN